MKEELAKAKEVICNNCNIKNCATCSVTSIMMESRVNYLEKEVEELKTKLDSLLKFNKELITVKTEQQVVEKEQTTVKKMEKPKAYLQKQEEKKEDPKPIEHPKFKKPAPLTKRLYNPDENLQSWISGIFDLINDRIKYYNLDTTTGKIIRDIMIKMKNVYGFVIEQEKKDFKYNCIYDDRYNISVLEIIYNSTGYKNIFSNLVHDYISELCKDKVPVSPESDEKPVKEKVVEKKERKKYTRKSPQEIDNKNLYQLSISDLSTTLNDSVQLISKSIINYIRYITKDDSINVSDIISNENLLNCFIAVSDKFKEDNDFYIKIRNCCGRNYNDFEKKIVSLNIL